MSLAKNARAKSESTEDDLRRELAEAQDRLVRNERFAAVGLLLSDIAHEIYNPLAWVKLNTGLLRMALEEAQKNPAGFQVQVTKYLELLKDNEEGLQRIQHVVDGLRLMSRSHSERKEPEDLNALCQKTLVMLNQAFKKKGVHVAVEWGDLPGVVCNGNDVAQAVMNLLVNANDAVAAGGHVNVRTVARGSEAWIEISDDGPGIPEAVEARLFEPFVTSKPLGTGLGLPLVRSVADDHQGRVEWTTRRPGGSTFRFVLPVQPS